MPSGKDARRSGNDYRHRYFHARIAIIFLGFGRSIFAGCGVKRLGGLQENSPWLNRIERYRIDHPDL
jgi:hypothetical protein